MMIDDDGHYVGAVATVGPHAAGNVAGLFVLDVDFLGPIPHLKWINESINYHNVELLMLRR